MENEASDVTGGDESTLDHYVIPHDIILITRLWPVTKKAFSIQLLLHRMGSMTPSNYRRAQKTILCLDKSVPFK